MGRSRNRGVFSRLTVRGRESFASLCDQYSTKAKAQKAAEALRLSLNTDYVPTTATTVGTLVDRYVLEAMPERYSTSQELQVLSQRLHQTAVGRTRSGRFGTQSVPGGEMAQGSAQRT